MSKHPSENDIRKISGLFGGMAAANAIGQAMQIALEKGYTGICITFTKEKELEE